MSKSIVMTEETNSWVDLAKIIAICAAPFFLIQKWIQEYFKDKAQQRDAALQVIVNQTIDNRVAPEIKRLTESIDKLNEAVSEFRRGNK